MAEKPKISKDRPHNPKPSLAKSLAERDQSVVVLVPKLLLAAYNAANASGLLTAPKSPVTCN